jgi:WD40 repeat protein
VVSGSWDDTLKVWDTSTGRCLITLTGHTGDVEALAILPNGQVVSASQDNTLKVWDAAINPINRLIEEVIDDVALIPECKMM